MAEETVEKAKAVLIGNSPWTTVIGYAAGIITEVDVFVQANGLPTTWPEWKQALLGIAFMVFGRLTKQSNVTNAKNPTQAAREVPNQ